MSFEAESLLPRWLLDRATLRGREYAWPLEDISVVIEEARQANLISVGGQLQFRLPDATCECYWIAVDTHADVSNDLPWGGRVQQTAESAARQLHHLQNSYDFIAEGRKAFGRHLADYDAAGHSSKEAMCFVWYVASEAEGG